MIILKQDENQIVNVIKRDGRTAVFDEEKIIDAIRKSFQAVGDYRSYPYYKMICGEAIKSLYERGLFTPTVEQIQDIVE